MSTLQFLSEVVDKSRSLSEKLHQEKLHLIADTKHALDEKDISHSQTMASVKKRSAILIEQKTQRIKELRSGVKEMEELAFDVAAEHSEALKLAKESEEKERRTETTAKNRLNDLKNMRDQNSQLKSIIEEDRETMQATILELMEDNETMQEQLHMKKEELALAEHDLNEACEEIHVSTLRGIAS